MGLKTKNYTIEEIGITLPEAYAVIKNLWVEGDRGNAEFAIQANRDNAFALEPIKRIHIPFTVNRNESPYKTAYTVAKGTQRVRVNGMFGNTVEQPMPFHGWEDDFQTV